MVHAVIAWASDFAANYDSPWSLIQKLCWLNGAPAPDVLHAARIVTAPCSRAALVKLRCDRVDWLSPRSASTESGLTAQAHRFVLDVKANFARSEIRRPLAIPLHACLRLCPLCIRTGGHSVVHQLVGLVRCPFHGVQLTSVCPACSRWLPEYAVGDIWPAYSCPGCHATWLANAERLPRVPPGWKVHEEKTIGAVARWMREVSHAASSIQGLDALREGWWFRASTSDDTASIAYPEARIWAFHALCPFPMSAAYLGQKPLGMELRPIRVSSKAQRRAPSAAPRWHSSAHAFAAIRSYVSQRRLVAHRQCIADAQEVLVRSRMHGQDVFEFNRDICPVGYAYVLWCARLDNYTRWLRKGPTWEWEQMDRRPTRKLQQALLNSFVGSLHQTILLQALVKHHARYSREVAWPVLYSDYDSWLSDPLFAGHKEALPMSRAQVALVLEPADGLSEIRCDHGRAVAEWARRLDKLAEVLEKCDSLQRVIDSKDCGQDHRSTSVPAALTRGNSCYFQKVAKTQNGSAE